MKIGLMVLLMVFSFCHGAWAKITDELTPDQLKQISAGGQVVVTEKVDGYPWPKMRIYEFIPCAPEEAEAVSMDYDLRASYTHHEGCRASEISQAVSPTVTQVDYLIHIPVLGDEHVTLENTVGNYDNGESYSLAFHLIRADRAKSTDGLTRFEAFSGGTLMAISNFVDPGVPMAGLVKGRAVNQTAGSASDFSQQVILEKQSNPQLLQDQLNRLRKALTPNQAAGAN